MAVAWINFAIMLVTGAIFPWLYIKSVGPAALEQKIGERAYAVCGRYRMAAVVFMLVTFGSYGVYSFNPLPVPLARFFPWPWWVSALIALALAIPAGYLLMRGMLDAGNETLRPDKATRLFGGIYQKIRHPQAWEVVFWFVAAFLLHSPFLFIFSFIWLPVEFAMVMAEEKDLLIRFGSSYREYRQRTGAFLPTRERKP